MKRPLAITTFGMGYMRPASGTWGSLPPLVVASAMIWAGHGPATSPWLYHGVLIVILAAFTVVCLVQGDRAEVAFGRKDPSQAVADETAGQCIPLLGLPAHALADSRSIIFTLALAFVSFRVMDILKPWPAYRLQRIPGGLGIVIDDLFAGLYALVIVQVAIAIAPG